MKHKHNDDILKTMGETIKGENENTPATPQPKKQWNISEEELTEYIKGFLNELAYQMTKSIMKENAELKYKLEQIEKLTKSE